MLPDTPFIAYGHADFFEGRFRGQFLGNHKSENQITQSVLLVHRVGVERLFRVRDVRAIYCRDEDETQIEFEARGESLIFDDFSVSDFFASTGTDHGAFFMRHEADITIGTYVWNPKNTRILAFTADMGGEEEVEYALTQFPDEIEFSQEILHAVSGFMKVTEAAE